MFTRSSKAPTVIDDHSVLDWGLIVKPGEKLLRFPILWWRRITIRPNQVRLISLDQFIQFFGALKMFFRCEHEVRAPL